MLMKMFRQLSEPTLMKPSRATLGLCSTYISCHSWKWTCRKIMTIFFKRALLYNIDPFEDFISDIQNPYTREASCPTWAVKVALVALFAVRTAPLARKAETLDISYTLELAEIFWRNSSNILRPSQTNQQIKNIKYLPPDATFNVKHGSMPPGISPAWKYWYY